VEAKKGLVQVLAAMASDAYCLRTVRLKGRGTPPPTPRI
jgi:hypothetical protein